jgi:hypothetical protein
MIDQSTPEDAIRILGKPKKDRLGAISAPPIDSWLTQKRKERIYRNMEFDKPEGIDRAWLSFKDGKLISIGLDVKNGISPNGLANIYGIKFEPVVSQTDLAFAPRDFERNQGKIYPKTYPTVYNMVGVSDKTLVIAMIGNVPSFGGALAQSMGVPDKPGSFPGRVEMIQIMSRTLENHDGADVLK